MVNNELISKNELIISNNIDIKSMIYTIRGQQVMLDSDLARIYGYSVKRLNEMVKNNIDRFPIDFMFQLSKPELDILRSKFSTANLNPKSRFAPYAFTEQGIYMLATVLKGELATLQSIYIIRSFKELRHMYIDNNVLLDRIVNNEVKLLEYKEESDTKFNEIFNYINNHKEVKEKIFFKGQVYDAFSFISNLIAKANKNIILIDNYIDIKTLNILAKKKDKVNITIYTNNNKLTNLDIETFNNEFPNLTIIKTNNFHDRFLILDNKLIYLIGASIKDAGNKCFLRLLKWINQILR